MAFIKEAISKVTSMQDLNEEEAKRAMEELMEGSATASQIASLLTALRMKGETVDEIASFASVMREHGTRISPKVKGRLTDTCGTGGDLLKTFNVSTLAALVVAGAGVPVAKHGNRSVTSNCGSADLLEKLGVNITATPEVVKKSIEQAGIGFLFAQVFHSATKNVALPRREIGIRTVFNLLGPLTNPAGASAQLIGVYDDGLVPKIANALRKIGIEDAIVVHGIGGLDEVSLIGETHVARLHNGEIREEFLTPENFGLSRLDVSNVISPENLSDYVLAAVAILNGSRGRYSSLRDMVLANASTAFAVAGKVGRYNEGVEVAKESLDSGGALKKLNELVKMSGGNAGKMEEFTKAV